MSDVETDYESKLQREQEIYKDVTDINVLPQIFHYWSNKYLRPMLEEFGASNPDQWFAGNLVECAIRLGTRRPTFLSIGAGNCDTEVRIAKLMRNAGLHDFVIECLDINEDMLARGMAAADAEGIGENISFLRGDFNAWKANRSYTGIMANQSLHHVLELEHLFDEVRNALNEGGAFVISDMIGRNGHMRWPEALEAVHRFWEEIPDEYKFNHLLGRREELYENFDCSGEGFEGIRAQDILMLLLDRFSFHKFVGFANVIDIFVDRAFGHNFDENGLWDRRFIDRVHALDESGLKTGALTPTHMFSVLTTGEPPERRYSRGLSPRMSIRSPDGTIGKNLRDP